MTYVITGAGGQLGSNLFFALTEELAREQTEQDNLAYDIHRAAPFDAIPVKRVIGIVHESSRPFVSPKLLTGSQYAELVKIDLTTEIESKLEPLLRKQTHLPIVVIHTAAVTAVADALRDPDRAVKMNADVTRALAALCRSIDPGARERSHAAAVGAVGGAAAASRAAASYFVHVSTDMVFDGQAFKRPGKCFSETDEPGPLSLYGKTKLWSEEAALAHGPPGARTIVVRVPLMFGVPLSTKLRTSPGTFLTQMSALVAGGALKGFKDETRTPISFWDAANAILRLLGTHSQRVLASLCARYEEQRRRRDGALLEEDAGEDGSVAPQQHPCVVHVAGPQRLTRLQMLQEMQAVLVHNRTHSPGGRFSDRDPAVWEAAGVEGRTAATLPAAQHKEATIEAVSRNDFAAPEPRPQDLSLCTKKYSALTLTSAAPKPVVHVERAAAEHQQQRGKMGERVNSGANSSNNSGSFEKAAAHDQKTEEEDAPEDFFKSSVAREIERWVMATSLL